MRIPLGHQIKITKRIEAIKGSSSNNKSLEKVQENPPLEKRTDLEPLEYNEEDEPELPKNMGINKKEPTKTQSSSTTTSTPNQVGGTLGEGTYNEKESHQSFLEALEDFRGSKKKQPAPRIINEKNKENKGIQPRNPENKVIPVQEDGAKSREDNASRDSQRKKSVRFQEDPSKGKVLIPKKNVTNSKEEERGATMEKKILKRSAKSMESSSQETETLIDNGSLMSLKKKLSCWQCFKVFEEKLEMKSGDKSFCSKTCCDVFLASYQTQCKRCKKMFIKQEGLFKNGDWFCKEECVISIEEMVIMWKKQELEGISYLDETFEKKTIEEDKGRENFQDPKVNIDLGVEDLQKDSRPLTLEELEEKYRKKNNIVKKSGEDKLEKGEEDNLEDSLEMD